MDSDDMGRVNIMAKSLLWEGLSGGMRVDLLLRSAILWLR